MRPQTYASLAVEVSKHLSDGPLDASAAFLCAARRDTPAADEREAHAMPGREEGGEDGSGGQGDPAE
jgi:hypothetical protein